MKLFEELGLGHNILTKIKDMGINSPTHIQKKSIPHILDGKDVIGKSATGSGKTLAFGCGIVNQVVPKQGLQALILAPTRELAEQVKDYIVKLSNTRELNVISIYGGVSIDPQIRDLRRANIVIATPGRLLDHMQRGTVDISKIKVLVLDEADRMFDMGFIEDVEKIIKKCPRERQTLFFSATISDDIKRLSDRYMINPIRVSAETYVDPSKLKQFYYDTRRDLKLSLLIHLFKEEKSGLVMVFCNTRKSTDFVYKNLKANNIDAIAIHGGLSQNKRSKTLDLFNKGKLKVLVCTDVAARGLHIENVSHVYNYEIPKDSKDYVHRIGRTARAGEEGKVVNLLSDMDYENFSRILKNYGDFSIEKLAVPQIEKVPMVRENNFRNNGFRRNNFRRDNYGNNGFRRRHYTGE